MSESSIETLEMRIAYQDATIEQLSDLVYAQSREIDRLNERYQQLESRIGALAEAEGGAVQNLDETPPHY
ncbi:SlyX family protein [Salinisphaera sp.]|uniref:SlyX family protein n=1 Tax=Salinisphaera sp. TaxID=1914330 RepID=UPI000C5A4855|nr:SlyX family protein [Salinisphaera sp.]MBS62185.1 SlyX protein [Salinisphaera sp.]